jgi:hypothetical protein
MEDLMCMAVFARVVEAKSFSGAARRLNVPSHGRPDLLISVIVARRHLCFMAGPQSQCRGRNRHIRLTRAALAGKPGTLYAEV